MREQPAIEGGAPVRETPLFYAHQSIDQADIDAVAAVLRSDFLTCGPAIEKTEEKLRAITGAKYAVLCANGTAALHIACMAAGIGEGDEIITTPITFAASANCALFTGARPVFADIDAHTWQLDPADAEKKITEKTKVLLPVDFGGQTGDMDAYRDICDRHGLVLIEDGAHSIGTVFRGKPVGSIADMTTLSFHPVKTICGGEGGAVLTNNEAYYKKLLLYRTHGITRDAAQMRRTPDGPWYYEQIALSTNYRITDMQAALIGSQLDKLPAFAARRKALKEQYDQAFAGIPQLVLQKETEGSDSVRHLYILRVNPERFALDRKGFYEALAAENIICNVHYYPIYRFPYYEDLGYPVGLCPQAESLYEQMLSIPFFHGMSEKDAEDVIRAVTRVCARYAK